MKKYTHSKKFIPNIMIILIFMFFVSCTENSNNSADLVDNKNSLIAPQGIWIYQKIIMLNSILIQENSRELFDDLAPYTVENFINLSEKIL